MTQVYNILTGQEYFVQSTKTAALLQIHRIFEGHKLPMIVRSGNSVSCGDWIAVVK